jgi:hypothetical protein
MYFAAEDNNAIDDTSVTRPTMTLYDLMAVRKVLAHSCQHAKAIMKLNKNYSFCINVVFVSSFMHLI